MFAPLSLVDRLEPIPHVPFLLTKLMPPPLPSRWVARTHLLTTLDQACAGSLTLVCGPAGYGKTSLVGAWVHGLRRPVCWISLDRYDNDPARLWLYLLAGLRASYPELALPESAARSPAQGLALLLNRLALYDGEAIVVLDNYDQIDEPRIHTALADLLKRMPPNLRLVLLSRTPPPLPLHYLRASDALLELGASELSFTPAEAGAFFAAQPDLHLRQDEIAQLAERAEGWVAGLQLASRVLREQGQRPGASQHFHGRHRFVSDYLAEELVLRQPAPVQLFLLQTALLDRMSAGLCAALLCDLPLDALRPPSGGAPRSHLQNAQAMLDYLDTSNVLLVRMDGERRWYRYHRLLAEALRAQMERDDPARLRLLHRRAASWCCAQGMSDDAIEHLLAAGDYAEAADLLLEIGEDAWLAGDQSRLLRWLNALPSIQLLARPMLGLLRIWALLCAGLRHEASAALHQFERDYRAMGRLGVQLRATGELAYALAGLRVCVGWACGSAPAELELQRRALTRLSTRPLCSGSITMLYVAMAYCALGDIAPAHALLQRAQVQSDGTPVLLGLQAYCDRLSGRLPQAAERYEQIMVQCAERAGEPLMLGYALHGLAALRYEWNDLPAAAALLERSAAILHHNGGLAIDINMLQAQIAQARGDLDLAERLLAEALCQAQSQHLLAPQDLIGALHARLLLARGDSAGAARWACARGLGADDTPTVYRAAEHLALVRILLAQDQPREALRLLERLGQVLMASGQLSLRIETLALQAIALRQISDVERAQPVLLQAIDLAASGGYLRTFADLGPEIAALLHEIAPVHGILSGYVAQLRSLCCGALPGRSAPPEPPHLLESLTDRELDVLRCIVAGQPIRDAAHQLSLAPSTVKWHLENLYSKLDAHNRAQLVVRAQALGLLV